MIATTAFPWRNCLIVGLFALSQAAAGIASPANDQAGFSEQSFDALANNAKGAPCNVIFKTDAIDLCGLLFVPRGGKVDYRYLDRTPVNNCNSFGFWCEGQDHSFTIGWKIEGEATRRSFTVVFRNRNVADKFNKVLAAWSDTTPADVRGPGNR